MDGGTRIWGRWSSLIALMILWIYMASSLLQSNCSVALKFILLFGVLVITEALIGISMAMKGVFSFALGLVFFGALLSNISFLHLDALNFPPDHWKLVVALAACGMLISSRWINDLSERLPFFHGFKIARPVNSRCQKLEITVSLVPPRFLDLVEAQMHVRIRHPQKSPLHAEPSAENSADGEARRYNEPDHKLPFWAR